MSVSIAAYQDLWADRTLWSGSSTATGLVAAAGDPSQEAQRTHDAATGFATDLTLRISQARDEGDKDTSSLAAALVDAVDYLGDTFGADTADAAMGIVYSRVGDDEITEDSLGKGLLDVIRFVDRNFGFEGGDEVIARFNGDLNDSLNEYFDNGLSEQFYAVTPQTATIVQAVPSLVESVRAAGDEAADAVADLLRESLEDGPTMTNLRRGLSEARDYLDENGLAEASAALDQAARGILSPLGESTAAPKGATLDIAI